MLSPGEPIMAQLNLELEEQLLQPEFVDKEQMGYSVNVDGVWYTDAMFSQRLNNRSVSGWRHGLPWMKRLLANFMQCRNLQQMGYDVSPFILRLRKLTDVLRGRRLTH